MILTCNDTDKLAEHTGAVPVSPPPRRHAGW